MHAGRSRSRSGGFPRCSGGYRRRSNGDRRRCSGDGLGFCDGPSELFSGVALRWVRHLRVVHSGSSDKQLVRLWRLGGGGDAVPGEAARCLRTPLVLFSSGFAVAVFTGIIQLVVAFVQRRVVRGAALVCECLCWFGETVDDTSAPSTSIGSIGGMGSAVAAPSGASSCKQRCPCLFLLLDQREF